MLADSSVRAGINPAPTQQVNQRLVEAGFTPARIGWVKNRIVSQPQQPDFIILIIEYYGVANCLSRLLSKPYRHTPG